MNDVLSISVHSLSGTGQDISNQWELDSVSQLKDMTENKNKFWAFLDQYTLGLEDEVKKEGNYIIF